MIRKFEAPKFAGKAMQPQAEKPARSSRFAKSAPVIEEPFVYEEVAEAEATETPAVEKPKRHRRTKAEMAQQSGHAEPAVADKPVATTGGPSKLLLRAAALEAQAAEIRAKARKADADAAVKTAEKTVAAAKTALGKAEAELAKAIQAAK